MSQFKFPLQSDSFSIWDRLKVCAFLLNRKNKLTIGPKTKELEAKWSDFSGANYAVATSSGSTAGILLVETFLQTNNYNPKDVTVFIPSTTWASSVSNWTMRGCKVIFVDINLEDFSFDYKKLWQTVNSSKSKIKVIWPTALIGNVPNIGKLKNIAEKSKSYLFADLCETTLGESRDWGNILSSFDMTITSFFWAHEINGIELGMLFINKNKDYFNNAQMIRNHGLTRGLEDQELKKRLEDENGKVDPEFLFCKEGTNLRPTDLNSKFALIDSEKTSKYIDHRMKIWKCFTENLGDQFLNLNPNIIPFSLPIIPRITENANFESSKFIGSIKRTLKRLGWEYRPIISFIAAAPAYRHLAKNKKFPNSEFLDRGVYVGIPNNLKEKDVIKLCAALNQL